MAVAVQNAEDVRGKNPNRSGTRAPETLFYAVFGLSVLIRLVALFLAWHVPFVPDARDYLEVAIRIGSGDHFVPYWPPGLPLWLAMLLKAGASYGVMRASMLVFWVLEVWAIKRLADVLGFAEYGWCILLIFAVMPSSVQMSIEPLTQQPIAALLLLALSAAVCLGREQSATECILLGLSLGAMVLTRPSTAPLLVLLPCFVLWKVRGRRPRALAYPVLAAVLAGAMVTAWMARTYRETGAWTINTSNGINLYYGNNPWTPLYRTWYFGSHAKPGTAEIRPYPEYERTIEAVNSLPALEASREYTHLALQHIQERPAVFLLRTLNRVLCYFSFDTFTSLNLRSQGGLGRSLFPFFLAWEALLYVLVAGFALFWGAASRGVWRTWEGLVLGATCVVYAAPYWLSMSHPTYHYPVMGPFALLGALAWMNRGKYPNRGRNGWIAVSALLVVQVVWVWQMGAP